MTDTNRASLEDMISTFRRRYVRPQSVATARSKWEQLHFDPSRQKFQGFQEQYQKLVQEAYGDDAPKIIEAPFYAKMPPHLKGVLNQARLETETYDTIVQHLEKEMELNGLSDPNDNKLPGIHQIDTHEQQPAPTHLNQQARASDAAAQDTSLRTVAKRPAKQEIGETECRTK